jgi:hypothetical protein
MEDTPTIDAAKRFLKLLREGDTPSDEELARALDELALAYHEAPEGSPAENDREPPPRSIEHYKRYAQLGKRFASYGYYAVGDWTEPLSKQTVTADAIDDLADIEGDLEKVLWRYENIGADDAHWHFKFEYTIHWGRHLRQLSLYLFDRTYA